MKTEPNKMNVRLLRRIQKQILKEPRQFQMWDVFSDHADDFAIPNCGTAACIAGWAITITSKTNPAKAANIINSYRKAGTELGLEEWQADMLFNFGRWPAQFQKTSREGTRAFARQAVRRIDHFIKTKGAE